MKKTRREVKGQETEERKTLRVTEAGNSVVKGRMEESCWRRMAREKRKEEKGKSEEVRDRWKDIKEIKNVEWEMRKGSGREGRMYRGEKGRVER